MPPKWVTEGNMKYTIDISKCTGCLLCSRACFLGRIEPDGKGVRVLDDRHCIGCGHCFAVCPVGAVVPEGGGESVVEAGPSEKLSYEQLMGLLRGRRSRREFKADRIPRELLDKLVAAAAQAPNGLNKRQVGLNVITDPDAVRRLSEQCVVSVARMARMARNPVLRPVLRTLAPGLYNEIADLLPEVDVLVAGARAGEDVVLYNAPCVILVHSPKSDICGPENALYCAGNILLAAETLGLGACVIGFVTGPMKHDPEMKRTVKLPRGRVVHTTIVVGYPEFSYARPAPVPELGVTLVE